MGGPSGEQGVGPSRPAAEAPAGMIVVPVGETVEAVVRAMGLAAL
ncbi:MAG: hypothetical protein ACTHMX_08790 [Thermomicrobiales bacterium]